MGHLRLVTCLLGPLLAVSAFAQTFFKSIGTSNANESGQCIVATANGNFAIGGSKGDSALVLLVDPTGVVLWSRSFRASAGYDHTVYQLASTPEGDIIGTGNAYGGNPHPEFSFLFKFNLAGDLLWHTRSSDTRPIWTNRILPMSPGSYMALPCIYDLSSPTLSDLYTASVDAANGLMLSNGPRTDFTPTNPGLDEHYSAIIATDGSVYACGRVFMYGDDIASMRPHVSHYDASGTLLWSKYFMYPVSETARIYAIDIIQNDDSLTVCYFGNIDGSAAVYNAGLIRMDMQGNVAWTKDYDLPDFTSDLSYKVLRMPYGYAITGYGTGERDLFVLALDVSGSVLWCNRYGSAGVPEFLPRTVTPNAVALGSDILFTGTQEIAGDRNIIYARIDASGNASCATSQPIEVVVSNVPPFVDDLTPVEYPDVVPFQTSSSASTVHLPFEACATLSVDLGPDQFTCDPIVLSTSLPGATFLWSTGSTSTQVTVNAPDTIWVEASLGCCSVSDTVIIHPGEAPVALFTVDIPPCGLDVTLQNASENSTALEWDLGDGTADNAQSVIHSYNTSGSYYVRLVAFNACGSDTTTLTISLATIGSLELIAPAAFCSGSNVDLSFELTDDNPVSQVWSTGGIGPTELIAAIMTDITVDLTVVGTNGCTYTGEVDLSPSPIPIAQFTQQVQDCSTLVQFNDGSQDATSLNWDLGNGTSSELADPEVTYPQGSTFSVVLIASNGCGSDTAGVTINTIPSGSIELPSETTICIGAELVISLVLIDAEIATATWSTGSVDIGSITLAPTSDVNIAVEVIDQLGCIYTDSISVAVAPTPIAQFNYEVTACSNSIEVVNNSEFADSFEWFVSDLPASTQTTPTLELNDEMGAVISLVAINSCGSDTVHTSIALPPAPDFSISGPSAICSNDPIQLAIQYSGISTLSTLWSTGDTSQVIELEPVEGSTIEVTGLSADGCTYSASFAINFVGDDDIVAAYVPNVFTPNGDSYNDVFAPVVLTGFISLTIFNRWGEELYQTMDLQKPWTGQYKGKDVPDGTYVYIVRWKDSCAKSVEDRIGHVTLLR